MHCYLYIAKCRDGMYYTGITRDLVHREWEHNHHLRSCLQKSKIPLKIIYSERYNTRAEAALREKEVKGWSRLKKEKLIQSILH